MLIIDDLRTKKESWQTTWPNRRNQPLIRPGVVVMKFGEQLRSSVIKEYQWYYLDYDSLKAENEKELEAIQKEEDEAAEKAGETEVQAARGKRAEYFTRIGDKVGRFG